MSAAVSRHAVEDDPEVSQRYGDRLRRYRLVGGRKVTDTGDGSVWFECRICDYRAETPHGIAVHRGWRHPGAETARSAAGQARTYDGRGTTNGDVVLEVTRLIDRVRAAEADVIAWRDRALNAEAAARELRSRGGRR